jgi:hypothetical protein
MDNYEVQKWTRILNHPKSSDAQKEEARQKIGQTPTPQPTIQYRPEFDALIEGWLDHSIAWHPLDERPAVAEQIYSDLVITLICSGYAEAARNEEVAARLMAVLPVCRSPFMVARVGNALRILTRTEEQSVCPL